MGEAERVKIEEEVLGGVDCPVLYDDSVIDVDGWILPVIEVTRIQQFRIQLATSTCNYFSGVPPIPPSDLCSFVADIEGVLLLPSSGVANTSLDPRSLIGSYVSSTSQAGTFEGKEGVLVRAMRQGKWVVFKDISPEVLGVLKPLVA
ncbi:hypothetical protein BDZ89DRAFT_1053878 [Hymenopellis radicata]|nr:hypothetical protein BDZ89DRAFT_1053878 [Hymenopellis radicata]